MKNSSVTDHSDKNTIINSKSDTNFNLTVSNLNEKANHKDFGLIPTASNKYAVKLGSGMRDSLPGIKKNRFGLIVKGFCYV